MQCSVPSSKSIIEMNVLMGTLWETFPCIPGPPRSCPDAIWAWNRTIRSDEFHQRLVRFLLCLCYFSNAGLLQASNRPPRCTTFTITRWLGRLRGVSPEQQQQQHVSFKFLVRRLPISRLPFVSCRLGGMADETGASSATKICRFSQSVVSRAHDCWQPSAATVGRGWEKTDESHTQRIRACVEHECRRSESDY